MSILKESSQQKLRNTLKLTTLFTRAWKQPKASSQQTYRKIPEISPGAYMFQRPFLRGLFLAGLIFGGAYLRREICVSKLIGLAWLINGRNFTVFALFSKYKPPGGLYLEGLIFGILRYSAKELFTWRWGTSGRWGKIWRVTPPIMSTWSYWNERLYGQTGYPT